MGIIYLSIKFELDRSSNNGDLLSDRKHRIHKYTDTHTHKLNLIVSRYRIELLPSRLALGCKLHDPTGRTPPPLLNIQLHFQI